MRRKFLFRGKHLDTGKWLYGSLITTNGLTAISTYDGAVRSVDPGTVGQYTGIEDNDHEPIFEGDILKVDGELWKEYGDLWEVLWMDFGWVLHRLNGGCSDYDYRKLSLNISCEVYREEQ